MHCLSTRPDGSALVTVTMGNTVVFWGRITHGRALPRDSYTGKTTEATATSRRRVDTSLAAPGDALAAVTGISSAGQLVTVTLVGQVTSIKPERGCPRLPLFFHRQGPDITVGRLARWYLLHTGTTVQQPWNSQQSRGSNRIGQHRRWSPTGTPRSKVGGEDQGQVERSKNEECSSREPRVDNAKLKDSKTAPVELS
ncbi:hypothetical protein V8C86DRAFT_2446246 [Haematococcus lacustris]